MKNKRLFFLCIMILIGTAGSVSAQTNSQYIERSWHGFYKGYADVFSGGEYYMTYQMYNVVASDYDNSFTATMSGMINIEGTEYNSTWTVTGSVSDSYSVYLNYNYTVSADQLPEGLVWIYGNLTGTLYQDADSDGDLIIHGDSGVNSGDTFELDTAPSY